MAQHVADRLDRQAVGLARELEHHEALRPRGGGGCVGRGPRGRGEARERVGVEQAVGVEDEGERAPGLDAGERRDPRFRPAPQQHRRHRVDGGFGHVVDAAHRIHQECGRRRADGDEHEAGRGEGCGRRLAEQGGEREHRQHGVAERHRAEHGVVRAGQAQGLPGSAHHALHRGERQGVGLGADREQQKRAGGGDG